jgi:hypothetical protein
LDGQRVHIYVAVRHPPLEVLKGHMLNKAYVALALDAWLPSPI